MDTKINRLIVSNKNEEKGVTGTVYVHLNHLFENNKMHYYLTFMSDIWHEGYFLPLNHVKKNGKVSSLNTLPLFHEKLGFNLEEIWKSENISLYGFLNETYRQQVENKDLKEEFALKVTKFMYYFLGVPFEQTMKILNWIHNSNYTHHTGRVVLLTTFKIEKIDN